MIKSIQEYGCSLGGGFKFKPIANQIDFNFALDIENIQWNQKRIIPTAASLAQSC